MPLLATVVALVAVVAVATVATARLATASAGLAALGILLAVAVTGRTLLHKRSETLSAQTAVLDLRDRSVARGTEANPEEPPLEIARTVSHVKIYLPLGSSDGYYEVRISDPQDRVLFSTNGIGSTQQGITSLVVDVNL